MQWGMSLQKSVCRSSYIFLWIYKYTNIYDRFIVVTTRESWMALET